MQKIKSIKYLCLVIGLFMLVNASVKAQYFQATMTLEGSALIFKIRPTGGDISDIVFANMEFYIRYPSDKTLTFATPVVKITDIPSGVIQKNDPYTTITEAGYNIVRFFLPPGTFTTRKTYTNNTEYEVFRTTVEGSSVTAIEMIHRDNFTPYYLAIDSETGDLTGSQKFYGTGLRMDAGVQILSLNFVLPVELLEFKGQTEPLANVLNWTTAQEEQMSHFVVEKSVGQSQKFIAIGEQKATNGGGKTPQYYSFTDTKPNTLDYYRLKMVDLDGQFKYSKTISIARRNDTKIDYYPNPAKHVFHVQLEVKNYKTVKIDILDMSGKIIATQSKNRDRGDNTSFVFNVENFPNGVYTAAATIDGIQSFHKITVAK
jgi:hypothetical protein